MKNINASDEQNNVIKIGALINIPLKKLFLKLTNILATLCFI